MTVMGAELSAAVIPVTRVPVTITASVAACATSCAKDGAAVAARTRNEVPSRRDDLNLERYDIRNPRDVSPWRSWCGSFLFVSLVAYVFCAVRYVLMTLWPPPQGRKSDSFQASKTELR